MKIIHFLVIFSISLLFCSCSKEPADKVLNPLDVNERQNLEVLCKVWGLVKYHHPAFMKGSDRDADADLLDLIPKIREANVKTRNQILLDWIKELGPYHSSKSGFDQYVNTKKRYGASTIPEILIDLSWLEYEGILGTKLAAELPKIRYAIRAKTNKYLQEFVTQGVTDLSVNEFLEESYDSMTDPSTAYRLLALFRYWNIIEYFYPLKHLLSKHWDDVLSAHIPAFVHASGNLEYRLAVARLMSESCDYYQSSDWVPVFGNRMINSFSTTIAEERLIVSAVIDGIQIKTGDEIVSIGGKSIADIKSKVSQYFAVSNRGMLLRLVNSYARRTNDPTLSVSYLSNGELKTEVFPTFLMEGLKPAEVAVSNKAFPVAYTLVEEGRVGYINAQYYVEAEAAVMMNALKNTKGIIIDARSSIGYNFGEIAYNYFTNIIQNYADDGYTDILTPGIIYHVFFQNGYQNFGTYSGKVVIIINENTRQEWNIMKLQTIPGAITIGSQTCGCLTSAASMVLPGNIKAYITIIHSRYPNGKETTQFDGLHIDIEVKPTIAGIKAGRDELYEKAVELILK